MSKTAENLIYEVAGILRIAVAGEALGSIEHDTINDCIDPVLAEIADIVYCDRDDIPDRYFQTIARLVSVHAAAKFSGATVDLEVVKQHEARLQYLAAPTATYATLKAVYY